MGWMVPGHKVGLARQVEFVCDPIAQVPGGLAKTFAGGARALGHAKVEVPEHRAVDSTNAVESQRLLSVGHYITGPALPD